MELWRYAIFVRIVDGPDSVHRPQVRGNEMKNDGAKAATICSPVINGSDPSLERLSQRSPVHRPQSINANACPPRMATISYFSGMIAQASSLLPKTSQIRNWTGRMTFSIL